MKTADRVLQRWRVRRALPWIEPGSRVLDVGCADGVLFDLGRDRVATGLGIDPEPPAEWHGPTGTTRVEGFFPEAVPGGEEYDAIVMLAVVEHVEEPALKVWAAECARLLRPGGRVVITVPSPLVDSLLHVGMALRLLDGMEAHQHHGFDPRRVPDLFATAGFTVEKAKRFQLGLNNLFVLRRAD